MNLPNSHLLNAYPFRFADDIFPVGGKINERDDDHKHRGKHGHGDKEFDQEFYKFHKGRRQEIKGGVLRFFWKRKE